jgi:hypothetical protein
MIHWRGILMRDDNVYIGIPKNGISTFSGLLKNHGYKEVNLFDTNIDLAKCNIWGHVTNPLTRHTNGIAEYISYLDSDIDYTDPVVGKMLVSGMFDPHTYTIHMMLGYLINYPITWIPLDEKITKFNQYPVPSQILNGNDLTNEYFQEQGLEFRVSQSDHMNPANDRDLQLREKVNELKKIYHKEYNHLIKDVLEADILLYYKTLDAYRKKYSPGTNV